MNIGLQNMKCAQSLPRHLRKRILTSTYTIFSNVHIQVLSNQNQLSKEPSTLPLESHHENCKVQIWNLLLSHATTFYIVKRKEAVYCVANMPYYYIHHFFQYFQILELYITLSPKNYEWPLAVPSSATQRSCCDLDSRCASFEFSQNPQI